MGGFRYREDVVPADCAVEAWGDSLDDLFATSAAALVQLMADPESLGTELEVSFEIEAGALDLLLVDFLSELLFRKDRDRALFREAFVRIEAPGAGGSWRLSARLRGSRVDPERTRRGIDVKAVTMHDLAVEEVAHGWHARFVVDL